MGIDKVTVGRRWLRAHLPELIALGVGVLLRLSMALTYDARIGYDYSAHWPNILHYATQHALPPFDVNTASAHPPLYYVIAAALVSLGLGEGALGWLAALWAITRLVIIWAALERWLPESRIARRVALATACVLPTAVHLDGMITNEALGMLFAAIVLLLMPSAIVAVRRGRVAPMVGFAVVLGLAMLTKLTALILMLSGAVAVALEIARAPSWTQALRARWRPLLAGALVLVAMTGWYFRRNVAATGMLAPTAFEGSQKVNQAPYETIPYVERRPIGFYVGWNLGIYTHPLYPTGLQPDARFFPVLIATTFNDYYSFSYSGGGKYRAARRWVSGAGVTLGCMSVMGGTLIALVTVIAWPAVTRALWRRRDDGEPDPRFALVLAPFFALLGLVHFVTKYPNDTLGPIKGAYLQFVAPVLCALFGLGVAWMWRQRARRLWRVPAVLALGGLALVAAYSVHARFPRFGSDANTAAPFFASDRAPAKK